MGLGGQNLIHKLMAREEARIVSFYMLFLFWDTTKILMQRSAACPLVTNIHPYAVKIRKGRQITVTTARQTGKTGSRHL